MASLKEIMNIDEESLDSSNPVKRDRGSAPKSSEVAGSTPSSSRYASPINPSLAPSSSAQGQRQSPPSLTPHSLAAETNSLSSGTSNTASRRRSNTSTDSMESSPYYQDLAYGQSLGPSSSMGPSRSPYGSSAGPVPGGEPPVKLTPITGRVSRAKKGVPVHTCEMCRPPKTFTRAEHLRRHQLSHQAPDLACSVPGCDKVFHRKDLLERHQLRHEQERRAQGDGPSGVGGGSSAGSESPYGPSSSQVYPMNPASHLAGSDIGGSWPSMGGGRSLSDSHSMGSHGDVPGSYRDTMSMYPEPNGGSLYMPPGSTGPWHNSHGASSATSPSHPGAFASHSSAHSPGSARGPEWSSSMAFPSTSGFYSYATSTPHVASSAAYDGAMGLSMYPSADDSMHSSDALLNTTVRSLSPPLAVAQSSETLVTMPSAVSTLRITNTIDSGHQADEAFGLLTTPISMPVSLNRAARDAIPAYLDVYWEKVHPTYPIVHRSTFDEIFASESEHRDVLQCAMAAVATQFLEDISHRINGHDLHTFAWHKTKLFTDSDTWDLFVMQSVLLCEYYTRFRGRKKESHQPSPQFITLYRMVVDYENTFATIPNTGDLVESWRQWIVIESRRRLFSACFMLDLHSACYYEQPPVGAPNLDYTSPSSLYIPLSAASTSLWNAPDYRSWGRLAAAAEPVQTVSTALLETLTSASIASAPPYDAAILLSAWTLHLPKRQSLTKVSLMSDTSMVGSERHIANIFRDSGIANMYLALHFTPLHVLLSVSGDSWVFNKKVPQATLFTEHQQYLKMWQRSSNAVVAVALAARALRAFLGLTPAMGMNSATLATVDSLLPWKDISDYWGVYVSALICWAFAQGSKSRKEADDASRATAVQWILRASELEPSQIREWPQGKSTRAVVCLARDVLSKDCVGGRNMLFADSAGVLRKLAGRGTMDWS